MKTYEPYDIETVREGIEDGALTLTTVNVDGGGTGFRPTVSAGVSAWAAYGDIITVFYAEEAIDMEHDWGEPGYVDARAEAVARVSDWLSRLGCRLGKAKNARGSWFDVERA